MLKKNLNKNVRKRIINRTLAEDPERRVLDLDRTRMQGTSVINFDVLPLLWARRL